jgi:2,4-dienoyl-CoA reductase-like NADH-dependent reductase (Old Yellow Enzyme family)
MPSPRYESSSQDASALGKPLEFAFSGISAPNRFLKGAMTERLSSWDPKVFEKRGIPSENLINSYKIWGEGGIGLILTGNIMIDYDQLEAMGMLETQFLRKGIYSTDTIILGNPIIPRTDNTFTGERFEAFKKMASVSKAHGSLIVGQVSHPGRQCENRIQPNPVSASDVQLEGNIMGMNFNKPHAATDEEIARIIDGFAHSAEYLYKAGYDGIELHGAHGYLLAQFLSETTNQRTDKYGGSLENRARLITEIAQETRKRVPKDFVVGIKLNSVEFQSKGFQPEEAKALCQLLEQNSFDFVELSGGTYESLAFSHKRESTKKRESFFVEFAEQIVPGLKKTKTYVTGGFKSVGAMVDALKTVAGVGLARPVTQEPRLCKDILDGKVTGAIQQKFDDANFGLTNVVAGTQIRQLGKDQEPLDGSDQEVVDEFMKDMNTWGEAMGKDEKMERYGYIDLESVKAVPYGTAAAS